MTINEAIEKFKSHGRGDMGEPEIISLLSDLDLLINRDVLLTHNGAGHPGFAGYDPDVDREITLLVPPPYTDIYYQWLRMHDADNHSETEEYNIATQKYYELYQGFGDWINRRYMPKTAYLRLV